uniref:Putative secreted protein n=1 Tax=Amblyomma parvum TaxID=251391 RepID=A0A023G0P8_AMBPA
MQRFPVRPSLLLLPFLLVLVLCTVCAEGRSGAAQWGTFTRCVGRRAGRLLFSPGGSCAATRMYFHCMANSLAMSCRGRHKRRVAEVISLCREVSQPGNPKDRRGDEAANRFGRNGGNCGARYLRSYGCAYNPRTGRCKW